MEGESPDHQKGPSFLPVAESALLANHGEIPLPTLTSLFSSDAPLWISFFPRGDRKLSGFLSWLDIWHSGMISRGLSPHMKGVKPYPESFLFYPIDTPVPNGILIIPFEKGKAGDRLPFLPDTLMGLSVNNVIIDGRSLPPEVLSTFPEVSVLATPDLKITIRVGKKEDYPKTILRPCGSEAALFP
ncbi:hypothetical protein [Leptospirillum ferrooxidans]|jgi:hypothetical protein|uniref:Uncharacterized protein n=1 Tax=Leptospirillum ferrooxidans (strain C2-3) TaxID=1162668 RepID=I0INI2_LEPFC|nr:hypothetical protein [Leptospirillum ferrooxidans]BAM06831.1 hypothetical protein LFE_1140 [Leptospirillum ferrooxidans C2-3]